MGLKVTLEDGTIVEVDAGSVEGLDELINEKVTTQTESLKSQTDKLLTEAKKAKEERRLAEESVKSKDLEAAKAKGDFEQLFKSKEQEHLELLANNESLVKNVKSEKINSEINKIVNELGAGGSANTNLLDLIKARFGLDYDLETGEVKVSGNGVASLTELRTVVETSGNYDMFLNAGQSNGGGANPSNSGAGKIDPEAVDYTGMTAEERLAVKDKIKRKI
jgi:hypothetical protein